MLGSPATVRRLAAALTAVLATFLLFLAAPASASTGSVHPFAPAGCTSGNLCFWVDINYGNGPGKLSGNNRDWSVFTKSACRTGTWADCASSIYNNGNNCTAHVYYLANYGVPRLNIGRGVGYNDLRSLALGGGVSGNWNDNIRSNSWC